MRKWRWLLIPFFVLAMTSFPFSAYSGEVEFLKRGSEGGIAFLSGGIGKQERGVLQEMEKEYPLKLVFSNRKGEYLSDVIVKVFGQKGDRILTTVSNGPWLFLDLPDGIYNLEASFNSDRKKVSGIQIVKRTQKVVFIQWQFKKKEIDL